MKLQEGPSVRVRKNQRNYINHKQNDQYKDCVFCSQDPNRLSKVLEDHKDYYVIENMFPYDVWDGCDIEEHLMIIPKQHTDSLARLSQKSRHVLIDAIAQYEDKGYSIYARSAGDITKSIVHQHTHLIKLGKWRKKFVLYLRKPHLLLFR